jgi:hypothetical protein
MLNKDTKYAYIFLIIFLSFTYNTYAQNDLSFEKIWSYETDAIDKKNTVQAKPKEYDDLLLFVDGKGYFFALDKFTGELRYKVKLGQMVGRRGFAIDYSQGYVVIIGSEGVRVGLNEDATLFKIDVRTGDILNKTVTDWSVVEPVLTSKCIVTFGARDGIIKCHDRNLKNIIWQTKLGPNARVWSNALFSDKHNMIYFTTSDYGDIVGNNRNEDLYSSSLIGINSDSGEVVFSRQMIKEGVWDFDGVGKPIFIENFINDDGKIYDLVVGLNKTGTIFVLNAIDGSAIKTNQFNDVIFPEKSSDPNLLNIQTIPAWPDRVVDVSLELDDLRLQEVNTDILRHVKYGDFVPPSVDYDVITRGLHGGPNWFGGEHFRHFEKDILAIPYNNNAWILRNIYTENFWLGSKIYSVILRIKRLFNYIKGLFFNDTTSNISNDNLDTQFGHRWIQDEWSDSNDRAQTMDVLYKWLRPRAYNKNYYKNCAGCHRNDRGGRFQSELEGDGHIPSLVGYTLTDKYKYATNFTNFSAIHPKELNISEEELNQIFQHYHKYDERQLSKNNLEITGYWQSLLAKDSLPLNKAPWGGIAVIDLDSGSKIQNIIVGNMKNIKGDTLNSSVIFGGIGEINSKGETLTVGTVDSNAYYLSLLTGEVLHTLDLARSGSSQPHKTNINGCEAWVIVESGGRYSFFDRDKNGYTVETFVNNSSCN